MKTPEKIAQAYLRLNGFFTIPHFTILKENGGHIDLLAVRLGGSVEKVGPVSNQRTLSIDEEFFSKLNININQTFGLIIEVKGGKNDLAEVDLSQFEYAKLFFGNITIIKKVGFENKLNSDISIRGDLVILSLKYCMEFIKNRFSVLKEIRYELIGSGSLSKEGSWAWSEDFLSDLIYIYKLETFDD